MLISAQASVKGSLSNTSKELMMMSKPSLALYMYIVLCGQRFRGELEQRCTHGHIHTIDWLAQRNAKTMM